MNPIDWNTRWPDFLPGEIFSPETTGRYEHKLCPFAMDTLQEFRRHVRERMLINHGLLQLRGLRSIAENKRIEGAALESMHICGRAFDITVPGMTSEELYESARTFGGWGGIGLYNTWVHCDTRMSITGGPKTWDLRR